MTGSGSCYQIALRFQALLFDLFICIVSLPCVYQSVVFGLCIDTYCVQVYYNNHGPNLDHYQKDSRKRDNTSLYPLPPLHHCRSQIGSTSTFSGPGLCFFFSLTAIRNRPQAPKHPLLRYLKSAAYRHRPPTTFKTIYGHSRLHVPSCTTSVGPTSGFSSRYSSPAFTIWECR